MSKALDDLKSLWQQIESGVPPHPRPVAQMSPELAAIGNAVLELTTAEDAVGKLKSALSVYANEYFYDELPPSKAKEDRGAIARAVLAAVDPT